MTEFDLHWVRIISGQTFFVITGRLLFLYTAHSQSNIITG